MKQTIVGMNLSEQEELMKWAQWALNVLLERADDKALLAVVAGAAPTTVKQHLAELKRQNANR